MSFWNRAHDRDEDFEGASSANLEAAARAKRARDHLARKRQRERRRLENARRRAEQSENGMRPGAATMAMAFVIAIVLGATSARFVKSHVFLGRAGLERVVVQGAETLPPHAIVRNAGIAMGTPLSTIDPAVIAATVSREPWIESARALVLPTGTLILSVVEKKAIARWRTDPSGPVELVDRNGTRFPGAIERGGPLPWVEGVPNEPTVLPGPAIEILREIGRHPNLSADPSRLTLRLPKGKPMDPAREDSTGSGSPDSWSYVLDFDEEGLHVLLGHDFLDQRIARLAALLESAEVRREGAHWIDLRYADRAVLRTESASG